MCVVVVITKTSGVSENTERRIFSEPHTRRATNYKKKRSPCAVPFVLRIVIFGTTNIDACSRAEIGPELLNLGTLRYNAIKTQQKFPHEKFTSVPPTPDFFVETH